MATTVRALRNFVGGEWVESSGENVRPIVSPVGTGDLRWDDVVAEQPDLAEWCAERWLAAHRRLGTAPARLDSTSAIGRP